MCRRAGRSQLANLLKLANLLELGNLLQGGVAGRDHGFPGAVSVAVLRVDAAQHGPGAGVKTGEMDSDGFFDAAGGDGRLAASRAVCGPGWSRGRFRGRGS